MEHSTLGHSDLNVTSLCMGTMTLGKEADEETSFRMLDAYVDAGGNFIDTADRYSMGGSEQLIGRWLKKTGKRDQLIIATKARFPMERGSGLHPSYLRGAIEDNLMRLDIETMDLFQPHAFDPAVHPSEWLGLMKELIDEGKVRYLGVSNFLGYQLQQTIDVAHYEKLPMLVSLQAQYNLLDRQIDMDILEVCRNYDIPLLPWSPLGGGWLTGKYKRNEPPQPGSRVADDHTRFVEAYDKRNNDRTFEILDEVRAVADEIGATMAQVSLAWVRQHPQVASVILGARNMEQLSDNMSSLDVTLSEDHWNRLEQASKPHQPDYPYGHMDLMGGR